MSWRRAVSRGRSTAPRGAAQCLSVRARARTTVRTREGGGVGAPPWGPRRGSRGEGRGAWGWRSLLPPPPPSSEAGGSSGRCLMAHQTITISAISGIFRANMIHRNPHVIQVDRTPPLTKIHVNCARPRTPAGRAPRDRHPGRRSVARGWAALSRGASVRARSALSARAPRRARRSPRSSGALRAQSRTPPR